MWSGGERRREKKKEKERRERRRGYVRIFRARQLRSNFLLGVMEAAEASSQTLVVSAVLQGIADNCCCHLECS